MTDVSDLSDPSDRRDLGEVTVHLDLELLHVVNDLDPVPEIAWRERGHGDFGEAILQHGSRHLQDRAS